MAKNVNKLNIIMDMFQDKYSKNIDITTLKKKTCKIFIFCGLQASVTLKVILIIG